MTKRWYLSAKQISTTKQRPGGYLLRLWHAPDTRDMYRDKWDRELRAANAAAVEELIRLFQEPWAIGKQLFDDSGYMRVEPEERAPEDTNEVLIYRFLGRMATGLGSASMWLIGPEPGELDALLGPWVERQAPAEGTAPSGQPG